MTRARSCPGPPGRHQASPDLRVGAPREVVRSNMDQGRGGGEHGHRLTRKLGGNYDVWLLNQGMATGTISKNV